MKNGKALQSMIIFGGVTEHGDLLSDIWEYSFKKASWRKLDTGGEVPCGRLINHLFESDF